MFDDVLLELLEEEGHLVVAEITSPKGRENSIIGLIIDAKVLKRSVSDLQSLIRPIYRLLNWCDNEQLCKCTLCKYAKLTKFTKVLFIKINLMAQYEN